MFGDDLRCWFKAIYLYFIVEPLRPHSFTLYLVVMSNHEFYYLTVQ